MPGIHTLPRLRTRTLRWPGGSARLGPWRSQPDVALVTLAASQAPSAALLADGLSWLQAQGFTTAVTNALAPAEALAFTDAGFRVRERLHLLTHDLATIDPGPLPTRRVKRRMYPAIIELDQACFDGFWRFDAVGLSDAIEATPFRRLRAGLSGKTPIAYAITGRAGSQGYLQRIGVAPHARGQGWGQSLVGDALHWLRRHGARQALVNTQLENDHALALYQRCGFRETPIQLAVMERSL